MRIGIPKEIKIHEYRLGATPIMVQTLVSAGHEVFIETNAGLKIGFSNDDYIKAGAKIVNTPQEIYQKGDLIIKVKEPQKSEYPLLREGQILF